MREQQTASTGAGRRSPCRETLTVEEAGKVLGIGRTLAYRLARSGQIPTVRLGGRVLVPRGALMRMLDGGSG